MYVPLTYPRFIDFRTFFDLARLIQRGLPGILRTVQIAAIVNGVVARVPVRGETMRRGQAIFFQQEMEDSLNLAGEEGLGSASLISDGPVPTEVDYRIFELIFSRTTLPEMMASPLIARMGGRLLGINPGNLNVPRLGANPVYREGAPWLFQTEDGSHDPSTYVDDGYCLNRVIATLGLPGVPPPNATIPEQLDWLRQAVLMKHGKDVVFIHPFKDFMDKHYDSKRTACSVDGQRFLAKGPGCRAKFVFPFEDLAIIPPLLHTIYIVYDGVSHVALPVLKTCEDGSKRFVPPENLYINRENIYYIQRKKKVVDQSSPPWIFSRQWPSGVIDYSFSSDWSIRMIYPFAIEGDKKAANDAEATDVGYLFFDFETVVLANRKIQPYAVSWLFVSVDPVTFEPIHPSTPEEFESQTEFYYGEDAATHLLSVISKADSSEGRVKGFRKIVGVTFNGSNFDNGLLFEACQTSMKNSLDPTSMYGCPLEVSRVFIKGTSMSNFTLDRKFSLFDVRAHLGGSLNKNCVDFKNKLKKLGDFNHEAVQDVFDSFKPEEAFEKLKAYVGPKLLPEGMKPTDYSKDEPFPPFLDILTKYAVRDTSCLAELFFSYRKVNLFPDLPKELEPKSTLASETFAAWDTYVQTELADSFTLPTEYEEEDEEDEEKNYAVYSLWDRMPVELIKELKDTSVIAGRVQLFHPPAWYKEHCVSMDVKSLYPYVMAVKDVYYPIGRHSHYKTSEIAKEQYERAESAGRLGMFKVTVDQSILKHQGLPVILAAKKMKPVKEDCQRLDRLPKISSEGNDWHADKVENLWITSAEMTVLKKYECSVEIHEAIIWSGKIKSVKLFGNLAHLMSIKNAQDKLKLANDGNYNAAKRQAAKLASNALYGKMLEGFHESTAKIIDMDQYEKIRKDIENGAGKYEYVSAISNFGEKTICQVRKCVTDDNFAKKQRPVVLGFFILAYARMYMYEWAYALLGTENCYYTDTDAIKTSYRAFQEILLPVWSTTNIPHWEEVEGYDENYKTDHIYEEKCRCYGGFEDEFDGKPNAGIVTIAKKTWMKVPEGTEYLCIPRAGDDRFTQDHFLFSKLLPKECKVGLKGVGKNDILLTQEEAAHLSRVESLSSDWYELCQQLYSRKDRCVEKQYAEMFSRLLYGDCTTAVLRSVFIKHMTQMKRNVQYDEPEKFVKGYGQMSHIFSISTISPKKNQEVTL